MVSETTGHASPVGWLSDEVLVVIDTARGEYEVVWDAAGDPHAAFPTSFKELIMLTHARPMSIGN